MLGNEHGMPTHRRLAAVIFWAARRQAMRNEFARVVENGLQSALQKVVALLVAKPEAHPKRGFCKLRKDKFEVSHRHRRWDSRRTLSAPLAVRSMAKRRTSTIPHYKRRSKRSFLGRLLGGIFKLVVILVLIWILWVVVYRFINPPLTINMIGDLVAGRGAHKQWMPITRTDRDMVRAAIAAEDGKFCSHHGFDLEAIEDAMKRNASGGRVRGGSTISQQTAKNAFLWNGGGYPRKAVEAWFTFLIEHVWSKRRIMEVYLNLAETGAGTYGVNAGSQRYFGHDSSAMSATEAARIAAVLPLPKIRGAIAPKGFTRRYGNIIAARIGAVARDGLDSCIYQGTSAPVNKAPPAVSKKPRPQPGEEYENPKAAPPVDSGDEAAPMVSAPPEAQPPANAISNETAPPSDVPPDPPNAS
jgi:monofunctional biosynthetic peptidoglycan transglycosylase